ncbi:transmembrane protein, putative (macronuclear) [Tetrahymena thermophila SB210]|uniref:Transmembrane protein, putative n=1 Tax=Tetrahymena thermophila (strain SB210) TaxID=312017 RepID=Q22CL8_TETTS|nr:transmembrane protein, putative [Tetrahymena thermophila SB210]EAR83034.4 transmembrane protein, putative [Tetrahymena thermophila SB210]|eukprot:XP_001030697.4 transmembrane protein, putative [Tetrahymena thermophila SB210]
MVIKDEEINQQEKKAQKQKDGKLEQSIGKSRQDSKGQFKENMMRFLFIFMPYTLMLLVIAIAYSVSMKFIYIQNMQNNLQSTMLNYFRDYLKYINQSEQLKVSIGFQRISSQTQTIGSFIRKIQSKISYNDFIIDQNLISTQYSDKKWNFLTSNDFNIDDICQAQDYLTQMQNQNQQSDYNYLNQQYFTWGNPQVGYWSELSDTQKQFIISQMAILQSLSPAYLLNQKYEEIKTMAYYLVNGKDGMSVTTTLVPRLLSDNYWNQPQFGSPFSCQINQNGKRRGYLFNSTSQFNGFQYMNPNYTYCFNPQDPKSQNNCMCEYENIKRLYPLDVRCRPWYLSSNSSSYVSFSDPYIDYDTNSLISTATFKVVKQDQSNNLFNEVTLQGNEKADAVLGLDFNLQELQQRYKQQNNSTTEYSYIVSAATKNFDDFQGNYEYTAITHPLIKDQKAKIYELEFQNSANKEEEIELYLNKTSFMTNTNIRLNNCTNQLNSNSQNHYEYITKNGQTFLTLFSAIQICYGNLYEQKVLTVGYIARCIAQTVYDKYISQITQSIKRMNQLFTYVVVSSFSFLFILLYFMLKQLLMHNFDIPISILNNFLQSADSKDIHELNQMIQNGKFKTQYELQNIITAINQIVISVQIQVEKEMDSDENIENLDKVIQQYVEAAKVYFLVDHKIGQSLCMNNLGFIHILKKEYPKALVYQQKANIISDEILQEFFKDLDNSKSLPEKQMFLCKKFNLFMNLHACRKFQLAQLIIRNISLGCQGQAFQQYYQIALEEDKKELLHDFMMSFNQNTKNSVSLRKQTSLQNDFFDMLQKNNKFDNPDQLKLYLDKKQEIYQKINKLSQKQQKSQIDINQIISVNDENILSGKFYETKQNLELIQSPQINSRESLVNYRSRKFYFSNRFFEKQNYAQKEKDDTKINELFSNEKNFIAQALDILYESLQIFQQINTQSFNKYKRYENKVMSMLTLILICKCHIILQKREVIIEETLQVIYNIYQNIKTNDFISLQHNQIPLNVVMAKYYLILAQIELSKKNYKKSLKYNLKALNFNKFHPNQFLCIQYSNQIKRYYDPLDSLEALQNIYQIIQEANIKLSSFQLETLQSDIQNLQSAAQNYCELGFFEVFFKLEKWADTKIIPL